MKLLDQVRAKLRLLHYALKTERSYLAWIEQFIRFCRTPDGFRHPRDLGAPDIERFLTSLAVDRRVAASTQNQALSAVLFLDTKVLAIDVGSLDAVRAHRRRRLPTVLSVTELRNSSTPSTGSRPTNLTAPSSASSTAPACDSSRPCACASRTSTSSASRSSSAATRATRTGPSCSPPHRPNCSATPTSARP